MTIPGAAAPRRPAAPSAAVMPAPPFGTAPFATPPLAQAAPLRERLLLFVIYITVLASSVAFIEPSPHDALMGVLALTCLIAGVRLDRRIAIMVLLLVVWNVGGILSLMNVPGQEKTIQFAATSLYLAVAAVLWACLFANNTMMRLSIMRSAYLLTAVMAGLAGIAGYLNIFPGAHALFAPADRALGMFKDPNVFAPFLIWPALVVLERMLVRRITFADIGIAAIFAVALLLAFSRGAWLHFGVSCLLMVGLSFLTARQASTRLRIVVMTGIAAAALAAFIVILLSIPVIRDMFLQRAQLLQSYDVGDGGRFRLQLLALSALLDYPNGMGPLGFASIHTIQQHNVYLQGFLVYGWIGGIAYIVLILSTFWVAFRSAFVATPWQPYVITTLATFAGSVAEGFIIDTDHWRHFFLLLGMLWGLWAATCHYTRMHRSLAGTGAWTPAAAR